MKQPTPYRPYLTADPKPTEFSLRPVPMNRVNLNSSVDPRYCRPIVGDIVLLHGGQKRSNAIVALQRVATLRSVSYSHVAVCVSGLLFVHSTLERGVHLVTADQLIDHTVSQHNWKVIRSSKLQEQLLQGHTVEKDMYVDSVYFIRQDYNRSFLQQKLPNIDSTSFCSELASKLYEKWGVRISTKDHSKILPGHIENVSNDSPEWIDVTWIYRRLFVDPKWAAIYAEWLREAASTRSRLESIAEHADIALISEKINRLFGSQNDLALAEVRRRYPQPFRFWFIERNSEQPGG